MDLSMFRAEAPGEFVPIQGTDPYLGPWKHRAFVPHPLSGSMPPLEPATFLAVADARAALAALDNTARRLPNPTLLRAPSLRREAQSTSALEGTYAPLADVLVADDEAPTSGELQEILNYVHMANHAFSWVAEGRTLSAPFLSELQGTLMRGSPLEPVSGRIRQEQVVIGERSDAEISDAAVRRARFVPPPAGPELEASVRDLVDWIRMDHADRIDPVVAVAMSHYQFETLHPFRDGNGRLGRLLIVLHLQWAGVLHEPTLTVSPWFEARRGQYYDRLLAVSTSNDWDSFVRFFAQGLQGAAEATHAAMLEMVDVQSRLREVVRTSALRADTALALVDFAVANPTFTVGAAQAELGVSYGRANRLVGQLVDLDVLAVVDPTQYKRRFFAPNVLEVLARRPDASRLAAGGGEP